ncbi:hypothetical protein TNCV_3481311 [Trichonephila clavipes]|nr:hypothetical protein TNCV_3481311 [Trichonephila clavipes]
MNRLYPNSRRESSNENQYLNTLPRRGEDGGRSSQTKTRQKYVTRAGMEERKEGGLNSPKNAFEEHQNAIGIEKLRDFFFCSWNEKENGDYKTELAAGTSVELKQEPALITDPNSDVGKCI